jgi:hypothetical protein
MSIPCATGISRDISSSVKGDEEDGDVIGEGGAEKDARGMFSADSGANVSRDGEKGEWGVIPMVGSFGADELSGGEKRRLGSLAASTRDVAGMAVARERLRPCFCFFSPDCHLRTPPLLARRARDTAFLPKVTNPSRGLTPADLLPAL